MPPILDPNPQERVPKSTFEGLLEVSYDYNYPRDLNLKPGSEFHEWLRQQIWTRAFKSQRTMSRRYDSWRETDRSLKAYVPSNSKAAQNMSDGATTTDEDDPLYRIVLPVTYANLETLLTYMVSAFLQDPIFSYEGAGPEDQYGAFLLTQHVAHQCRKAAVGLNLHTQWRDAFAYGFGAVSPMWHQERGRRARVREVGTFDPLTNSFEVTGRRRETVDAVLWEGNKLVNLDPYRYFPDPGLGVEAVQDGEFVGWLDETNYMNLRSRESNEHDFVFNAQYVRHITGNSSLSSTYEYGRDAEVPKDRDTDYVTQPVDVLWMYVTLIPNEWQYAGSGLGNSTKPEKWLFGLAGDEVIIAAQPLGLNHNRYPVAVAAPDYDGYSAAPAARLEVTQDLQSIIDFLYSSHIANIRKAINDMIVVDPSLVNIYDLNNPKPGKLIRLRRAAWGRGGIDAAVKQLQVNDVTQNHTADASFLMGFTQQVMGTSDQLQGVLPRRRGERISASEAQGARLSGLARLERVARIISMQSMQPLAYMFASHTQQFADHELYVKVLGDWPRRLKEQYGAQAGNVENNRLLVDPMDMLIDFDLVELDGTIPGSESAETWIQVLQLAAQNPQLLAQLRVPQLFTHIARHLGAKNVEDFINRNPPPIQVTPDEEVSREVEAGNLVPLSGDGATGAPPL